jgi:DNA-binding response OmpR family regulator
MKKKVLIIEDDRDTLDLLNYISEDLNLDVVASFWILPIADVEVLMPDLILTDHWINDKLGGEFCSEIKANPKTKHIPVVIVSAFENIAMIADKSCADAYLAKPFDLNELIVLIKKFID